MKTILQTLGAALATAGLLASVQAMPMSLSAVIDFEDVVAEPTAAPSTTTLSTASASLTSVVGTPVNLQYARFGLQFIGLNAINCSTVNIGLGCTAPDIIDNPPAGSGPHFLMNTPNASGAFRPISIKVLDGFSVSSMKFALAHNNTNFFVKFFDDMDQQVLPDPISLGGSDFRWAEVNLGSVGAAVRRIQFGSDQSAFALDYMSFDYVTSAVNVPEPTALSLVALALAGAGLARRRRA